MDDKYWQIGEVAEQLGVTTKTLRHYEKIGLIEPHRSDSGYRLYAAEDIERLQRIRQLQAFGLSLRQIKAIFVGGEDDGRLWQEAMQTLLEEVDAQIDLLEQRRELIARLLERGEDIPEALEEPEFMPPALQLVQELLVDAASSGPSMSLSANRDLDALLALTGYLTSIEGYPQVMPDAAYHLVPLTGIWQG